jgi:hypothetical protein
VKNIENLGKSVRIFLENDWIDNSPFTAYKEKKRASNVLPEQGELAAIAGKKFLP